MQACVVHWRVLCPDKIDPRETAQDLELVLRVYNGLDYDQTYPYNGFANPCMFRLAKELRSKFYVDNSGKRKLKQAYECCCLHGLDELAHSGFPYNVAAAFEFCIHAGLDTINLPDLVANPLH